MALVIRPDESLLLRAVLAKSDDLAFASYAEWIRAIDIDRIEGGSFRLLPLLYKRLAKTGRDFAHCERLKGIYRQSLFRNSLLLHDCLAELDELERQGIPIMLLKGAALLSSYYRDLAVRPMSDVDLLVRDEDAGRALRLLRERGWTFPTCYPVNPNPRQFHSIGLRNRRNLELDLNLRTFYQCPWEGADRSIWERSETVEFMGRVVRIAGPTHQVLHNCAHGLRWNELSPIRWAVDVMKVLECRAKDIDWPLLEAEIKSRKLGITMTSALELLARDFNADIPESLLAKLIAMPKGHREQRLYAKLVSPPRFMDLSRYWMMHSAGQGNAPLWKKAIQFPAFLQNRWGLSALHQIPAYTLKRLKRWLLRRHSVAPQRVLHSLERE